MYIFSQAISKEDFSAAFKLRYKVYCNEKKWLDPSRYPNEEECDKHDDYSLIFLARSEDTGKVVGTARLIVNKNNKLSLPIIKHPSLNNGINIEKCLEISRFSIDPDARGGEVYIGLIRMLFRSMVEDHSDFNSVFFSVEERFLNIVNKLGFEFMPIGEKAFWFGDYIIPCKHSIDTLNQSVKHNNIAYHQWLWKDLRKLHKGESMINFIKAQKSLIKQSLKSEAQSNDEQAVNMSVVNESFALA